MIEYKSLDEAREIACKASQNMIMSFYVGANNSVTTSERDNSILFFENGVEFTVDCKPVHPPADWDGWNNVHIAYVEPRYIPFPLYPHVNPA